MQLVSAPRFHDIEQELHLGFMTSGVRIDAVRIDAVRIDAVRIDAACFCT